MTREEAYSEQLLWYRKICEWNQENVHELQSYLLEYWKYVEVSGYLGPTYPQKIEPGKLPVTEIPTGRTIPDDVVFWAIDLNGFCLIGQKADQIIHIDEFPRT